MTKVKKFYLFMSVLFAASAVLILAINAFVYIKLLNSKNNILYQTEYLEMLDKKQDKLATLGAQFEEVQRNADIINETLPPEKDASKLISDLNSITTKSGLSFNSIRSDTTKASKNKTKTPDPSLLQTQAGKNGREMPIIIDVQGSYGNFVKFIKSLENYQRLINVTSIEIKKSSDESSADAINATLKLTVYLKK
jgi:Tfp pilus assembly protein PilO